MQNYDYKWKMNQNRKRWMKRVAGASVAASLVVTPIAPNVLSNDGLQNIIGTSVAHAAVDNLMGTDNGSIKGFYNNYDDYTRYVLHNDSDIGVEIITEDYNELKYVVQFPEELSYILDDPFFQENLTNASNAGEFMMTGAVVDEDGEEYTVSRTEHAPANYVTINQATNSIEFDLYSFLTDHGFVSLKYFGFTTPVYQQGYFSIPNGEYTFKTALVAADQVDLDQVSSAGTVVLAEEEGRDNEEPEQPEEPTPEPEEPEQPEEPAPEPEEPEQPEEPGDDDEDDQDEPSDDDDESGDDDQDDQDDESGDDDQDDQDDESGDDDEDDQRDDSEKEGVFTLDMTKLDSIELKPELLQLLNDGQVVVLSKDGVELEITGDIFDNYEDPVMVTILEQETAEGSLSKTYDFEIEQNGEVISDFGENTVTLTFDVDDDRAENTDNLKVFNYNEDRDAWELVGGKYRDGKVSAPTNHLSTFTVFETAVQEREKEEVENDIVVTEKDDKDSATKTNDQSSNQVTASENDRKQEQGETLPDTATNTWTYGLAGALAVLAGFAVKLVNRFRREK